MVAYLSLVRNPFYRILLSFADEFLTAAESPNLRELGGRIQTMVILADTFGSRDPILGFRRYLRPLIEADNKVTPTGSQEENQRTLPDNAHNRCDDSHLVTMIQQLLRRNREYWSDSTIAKIPKLWGELEDRTRIEIWCWLRLLLEASDLEASDLEASNLEDPPSPLQEEVQQEGADSINRSTLGRDAPEIQSIGPWSERDCH